MNNKSLSPEALNLVAERFKVLSEPIRLQILQFLQDGERSVNEIALAVESSQPNVSKHLKILEKAGMLNRQQRGNAVYYSISDPKIFQLCEMVCGSIDEHFKARAEIFA